MVREAGPGLLLLTLLVATRKSISRSAGEREPVSDLSEVLPEGFRLIHESDCGIEFESGAELMDRFRLADYYEWSLEPDSIVLVRELDGRPVALVHITVHGDHVMIEMMARDRNSRAGLGLEILALVEKIIAPKLKRIEIRLEAKGEKLADWYASRGYVRFGLPYDDPEWGRLVPMKKRRG